MEMVWKKVLPNAMFGDFNPYAIVLEGDWLREPSKYNVHLGDVYINGRSMFEASSMKGLYSTEVCNVPDLLLNTECNGVTTERLGSTVYSEAPYENTDETDFDLITDMIGNKREGKFVAGAVASLNKGKQTIKVWQL